MTKRSEDTSFIGKPFSEVFEAPRNAEPHTWRIRYSGVQGHPQSSDRTSAVFAACEALGVRVNVRSSGSAANANSYQVKADLLDGGVSGETGNYWFGTRGVWVKGSRAVLSLALQIGLKVRREWLEEHGLNGVALYQLKQQLAQSNEGDGLAARAGAAQSQPR